MISDYIKTPEGSYKSKIFDSPQNIYLDNYWSTPNRSSITEQVDNVKQKNELVKRELTFKQPMSVLEVACSPAYLIGELSEHFTRVVGIEVDSKYDLEFKKHSKSAELVYGFFPEVTKEWTPNQFSNIIALDVFEHIEDGQGFINECARLLVKGGKLVIQSPIILQDGLVENKMFNGREHIWVYHWKHLKKMLNESGFKVSNIDRFIVGHEQISAIKIK